METNTEAYIRYDPAKENAWVKAIIESLKDGGKDYYKVDSKQLVTMLIIVIAKKNHKPFISEVSSTYAGVGLMNMMVKTKRNKTLIKMTYFLSLI
jgi:phosphatidylinositol-bisphosphatase